MPPAAWYAAIGMLVFCLIWRVGFYLIWRHTFGGRPASRSLPNDAEQKVIRLRNDGSPAEPDRKISGQ